MYAQAGLTMNPLSGSDVEDVDHHSAAPPQRNQPATLPTQTPPPVLPLPPLSTRVGHYQIKRIIASGGMGVVYEAVQDQPHRTVALKLMLSGSASPANLR